MARNYSLKSFLRLGAKNLLERHMDDQGMGRDLQLAKPKSKYVDHVLAATDAAGERLRRNLDRDFRGIFGLRGFPRCLLPEPHSGDSQ